MGFLGTLVKGAVTGIIGLGIASWAYSTFIDDSKNEEADNQEEE